MAERTGIGDVSTALRPRRILSAALSLVLVLCATIYGVSFADELYLIDAHSQAGSPKVLKRIVPLMDQAGVRRTILSGRRKLRSSEIADFAEQHPDRIVPAVRTKSGAYRDDRRGYYKRLERDVASGRFGAIAEILLFHARKGQNAGEFNVDPLDRRVETALIHARNNGWPFVIHIEFEALYDKEKKKFMQGLEDLLQSNRNHPFVLIHMGQLKPAPVRRLITEHKNIYFMTSHASPVNIGSSNQPWTAMFEGKVLHADWKGLVVEHPDRFVLAFDNVWDDHWGEYYLDTVKYWRSALDDLPLEVAHAVAHGNAERLWSIPKP